MTPITTPEEQLNRVQRPDRGPYPDLVGDLSTKLLVEQAQIMDGMAIGNVHPAATAIYALLDWCCRFELGFDYRHATAEGVRAAWSQSQQRGFDAVIWGEDPDGNWSVQRADGVVLAMGTRLELTFPVNQPPATPEGDLILRASAITALRQARLYAEDGCERPLDEAERMIRALPAPQPQGEDGAVTAALNAGRVFLRSCQSAWACGEPAHKVQQICDAAEDFDVALVALDNLPANPAQSEPVGGYMGAMAVLHQGVRELAQKPATPAPVSAPPQCATEGCNGLGEVHFVRGEVGSDFCSVCYRKVHAMEQERLAAPVSAGVDLGAALTALRNLETANDALCGARPQAVYDAMISAGMGDRMTELDHARQAARDILRTPPPASAGEGGGK